MTSKKSKKEVSKNTKLSYSDLEKKLTNLEKTLNRSNLLLEVSHCVAGFETLSDVLTNLVVLVAKELEAERCTLFLNDDDTGELYSIVAMGDLSREIRILNDSGLAGYVFKKNESLIVHDVYDDPRFDKTVDQYTGFVTKSVACVPVRTQNHKIIGVMQVLNKKKGRFTKDNLVVLEMLANHAAITLKSTQQIERIRKKRAVEMEFVNKVSTITSEINLDKLLANVMNEITRMLNADRSTLFLNDEKNSELFARIAQGENAQEIRMPNHLGIAGHVFTYSTTINIPHAYADLRFNPSFDKQTGFFTQSILCVPIINKNGKTIGVTQVLNKRGGPFTSEDESRLKAFTSQIAISLENSKLFDDVQNMKNYAEGMLESMSNGVITLNEEGLIATCNASSLKILATESKNIIGKKAQEYFTGKNTFVMDKITQVEESQLADSLFDVEIEVEGEEKSVNLTFLPLMSVQNNEKLGSLIVIEDISSEKRMKSTMSKYMDPNLADQVLQGGDDLLGGQDTKATVLFSDIRGFTTLTETLGAQGTVGLLNDYFTLMVDCINKEDGMLDKFIGDAIMAAFGVPIPCEDHQDKALKSAIDMLKVLEDWNQSRIKKGIVPVNIGIGLNTDNVVSGNIGSPKRMDYTMIGDGVNLAARLESACKQYSAKLLISEFTVAGLKGTYKIRDVDDVIVKGKTESVGVYEVLDFHTEESFPNLMEVVNYFTDGRKHYTAGRFDQAIKSFEEALKRHPEDNLSKTYIDRCNNLIKNPPKDWDGVLKLDSK